MAKRTTPWPRCSASSWRGACTTIVEKDQATGEPAEHGLCAFHFANPVADADPESAQDGMGHPHDNDTTPVTPTRGVEAGIEDAAAVLDESPLVVERVESLRGALREGAATAEVAELLTGLLLDGLRASRDVYTTCSNCKHRHSVALPDLATRIKAAQTLITEIEGRLAEPKESSGSSAAVVAAKLKAQEEGYAALSNEELGLLVLDENGGEPYKPRDTALANAVRVLSVASADEVDAAVERDRERARVELAGLESSYAGLGLDVPAGVRERLEAIVEGRVRPSVLASLRRG